MTSQTAKQQSLLPATQAILPAHCWRDLNRKMLVLLIAILSLHGSPDSLFADEVDDIRTYYQGRFDDLDRGTKEFKKQLIEDEHSLVVAKAKRDAAKSEDSRKWFEPDVRAWEQRIARGKQNITENEIARIKLNSDMKKALYEAEARKRRTSDPNHPKDLQEIQRDKEKRMQPLK